VSAVTVIDISRGREEGAREVARAVEEIGFLVVTGHGVKRVTVEAMRTAARALFSRPEEEKAAFADAAEIGRLDRSRRCQLDHADGANHDHLLAARHTGA